MALRKSEVLTAGRGAERLPSEAHVPLPAPPAAYGMDEQATRLKPRNGTLSLSCLPESSNQAKETSGTDTVRMPLPAEGSDVLSFTVQ